MVADKCDSSFHLNFEALVPRVAKFKFITQCALSATVAEACMKELRKAAFTLQNLL